MVVVCVEGRGGVVVVCEGEQSWCVRGGREGVVVVRPWYYCKC